MGGKSNDLIASYGSAEDTMLAFEAEVGDLKKASLFGKIKGEIPTKSQLKVPHGLA